MDCFGELLSNLAIITAVLDRLIYIELEITHQNGHSYRIRHQKIVFQQ